jgi:hypothetical protein
MISLHALYFSSNFNYRFLIQFFVRSGKMSIQEMEERIPCQAKSLIVKKLTKFSLHLLVLRIVEGGEAEAKVGVS